ncbi:hypothetical protein GOP47_0015651 [Adiantum capillus-veneris]|uniref:Pentatricopeptide repeat-containing protein n=1 Tax=Adiantum capillus-veneris TaxID=13818 RepID=A0A9D4UK63_ADICA|nr:hypothetical protein GOP47_0015651 [Adiantum capillus-veneris]
MAHQVIKSSSAEATANQQAISSSRRSALDCVLGRAQRGYGPYNEVTARMLARLNPRSIINRTCARNLTTLCEQSQAKGSSLSLREKHPPQKPSVSTFSALLQKCGTAKSLADTKRIHSEIRKNGLEQNNFLSNRLIWTYDKCGSLKDAQKTFQALLKKDIVSWNMMIAAYTQHGCGEQAYQLFMSLQKEGIKPDKVTFLNVLAACNGSFFLVKGQLICMCMYNDLEKLDIALATAVINMFGKCGSVQDASNMFVKMGKRNVITWTAMMSAYAQQGLSKEVIKLVTKMQQAGVLMNKITFVTMLNSCTNLQALTDGKLFHAFIVERKPDMGKILGTALVSMYGRCGSLEDARHIFDQLPLKEDAVLWTAMITTCMDYECSKEALDLFQQMLTHNVKASRITFTTTLEATANEALFLDGKLLHWHAVEEAVEGLVVGNALVTMYSRCGSTQDARAIFDSMHEHDLISWNALIASYTQQGQGKEVIRLFQQMKQEQVKPNRITFISLLSACSRAGLVDEACYYYTMMRGEYKVKPDVEHYRCMADLLGRVGRVQEAEELVEDMPYVPGAMAWSSLLGACKVHSHMEYGKDAAGHVLEVHPQDTAAVTWLSGSKSQLTNDVHR